ncbi:hypothetical protein SAMN05216436_107138 [bacterium A37T11]|nr:hypothetical protein SAMN05216436_107138 [bacterium A37T11]
MHTLQLQLNVTNELLRHIVLLLSTGATNQAAQWLQLNGSISRLESWVWQMSQQHWPQPTPDVHLVPTIAPDPDPATEKIPQHVSITWICDYLGIHRATFYRHLYKKLLTPLFNVGRRGYYNMEDVQHMKQPHQKGAHTYSKV